MKNVNLSLAIIAGFFLSACAAQSTTVEEAKLQQNPVATVKPGAAVSMSSALPKTMSVNDFHQVSLGFAESYDSGDLKITIIPTAGLSVFGGGSYEGSFKMTSIDTHQMSLDVSAATDGVYFLNVFAEAGGLARTFSVSVEIGNVTDAMRKAAFPENGELKDGVRVLQAQETIR